MRTLRLLLLTLLFISCAVPHARAWLGSNCPIYWKAYTLENSSASSPESDTIPAERRVLLALTIVPPPEQYLYGTESTEGLPTAVNVQYAPLTAFPMQRLNSAEIEMLLDESGEPLQIRAPAAPLKKDTDFARIILPGGADTNPPIYPGPVTFWTEIPAPESSLGGVAVKVDMSGLLCSASSCTPASGSLELAFSAREMAAFAPASDEAWWTDWKKGENVFIPAPEDGLQTPTIAQASPFSGGRSIPLRIPTAEEEEAAALAKHTEFFSTLEPTFFIASLEVQYLGEAMLLGLLAGLLLNLMPCVLPVVSLKFSALMAVSSMKDKHEQAVAFRAHCIIFALGIMTWFLILSILLGGAGWAWGELFQQPVVIVIIGMVLFLLGLSLFGVFSLPIFDLKPSTSSRHPHLQAFASGLLATLLATPCSGPLLGGVLAWAIRQPLPMLVMTIASVGIGMSLPYIILAFCPRLVHLLPRPGAWTLRLEQLLGFFLMGSVIYLATLLPGDWVPAFLFNLFAVSLAAWLWGQIGHLRASRLRRALSRGVAVFVLVISAWWGISSVHADTSWEAFDPNTFSEILGKEPLLLEFTADWCPSCKALEHTTLNKNRMADLRRRYNVRTIRVDLTRDAEAGKELLKALNSTSIPVLALFPEGEDASRPVVLRDLVTPAQLEEAARQTF